MKGKKVSNYEFTLENLIGNMPMMMNFAEEEHERFNTETKNFIVDTVEAPDTGCWETGISSVGFDNAEWIIVEEYETKKEAKVGHNKWVKYMESNPKKLHSIQIDETYKFEKA